MAEQVNLKTKTTTELKALAYDLSALTNNYNQMLQVVNQEIAERGKQEQEAAQRQQTEQEQPKSKLQAVAKKPAIEEAEVVE